MPVRTKEQADAATLIVGQLEDILMDIFFTLPARRIEVRHPEMLEEIHWDLTQIRGRLRLAVTGEYDAV